MPHRDLGYIASEGRFNVPAADETASGILALCSNYYEFIPEEETASPHPTVLTSDELEAGRRYSIVLTTAGGLYRYRIQDIVEVTGFEGRAPLVAFIRKEGETASITGEKLHVNHLILAFDEVRRYCQIEIEQFRAVPDYVRARYDIYLEIKSQVSRAALRSELLPSIDSALAAVNIEYAQKRASGRLAAPRLHLMRPGWAQELARRQIRAGKRDTQYKWPLLCSEPCEEDATFVLGTVELREEAAALANFPAAA